MKCERCVYESKIEPDLCPVCNWKLGTKFDPVSGDVRLRWLGAPNQLRSAVAVGGLGYNGEAIPYGGSSGSYDALIAVGLAATTIGG